MASERKPKEGGPCPACTKARKARGADPWPLVKIDQGNSCYILKCFPSNWWEMFCDEDASHA